MKIIEINSLMQTIEELNLITFLGIESETEVYLIDRVNIFCLVNMNTDY